MYMATSAPFDTKTQAKGPKDLSFLDKWIEEKDARQRAEQHVSDFRRIAKNWCRRAGEEHLASERNRRAFLLASLIAAIMTAAALVGWLR
jgi:hypothetical protein